MFHYFVLCNIFFIPLIYGNNITLSEVNGGNKTIIETDEKPSSSAKLKHTKVPIMSEGGSIDPDTILYTKSAIPEDFVLKEGSDNKRKTIVARKGVGNLTDSEETPPGDASPSDNSRHNTSITESELHLPNKKVKNNVVNASLIDHEHQNTKTQKNITNTKVPKKPFPLSSEDLDRVKDGSNIVNYVDLKSINTNRHPGMVMPVVITILVVPMFAVLGYMAIKRGREAWKNRHYKRMDFLLDGMYND